MDTLFWGPGFWIALHSITFDYPTHPSEQDKVNYKNFFHDLKYVLPCASCRAHYKEGLETNFPIEPALKNRETLSKWLVDFHNNVNKRLGKPIVSYESVKEKYEAMRGICNIDLGSSNYDNEQRRKTDYLLYIVITMLFIIILVTIYYFPRMKQSKFYLK